MSGPPTGASPRFARYRPTERYIQGRHAWAVPEGGLCLSAYVLVHPREARDLVLLGRPDPSAPWPEMAALESAHLRAVGDRWILPASHLREFESPSDAARRIARDQLGTEALFFWGPAVFSESYPSSLDPESGTHWDLQFIFDAEWTMSSPPRSPAWRELRFHDPQGLTPEQIARGHGDILALVGRPPGIPRPVRPSP